MACHREFSGGGRVKPIEPKRPGTKRSRKAFSQCREEVGAREMRMLGKFSLAAAITIAGCFGPYPSSRGSGRGEGADPREEAPADPEVELAVERFGFEGVLASEATAVMEIRARNWGGEADLELELVEWPRDEVEYWMTSIADRAGRLELHLGRGEEARRRWIMPTGHHGGGHYSEAELFLVARRTDGAVAAVERVPEPRVAGRHVVVLAADKEAGLDVQQAINRADVNRGGFGGIREAAVMYGSAPDFWYEYDATEGVLLARPWGSLDVGEREALRTYVAFGGWLQVLGERCPDWRDGDITRGARTGVVPNRFGLGSVFVSGAAEDKDEWLARTLPSTGYRRSFWDGVRPDLESGYVMPDARLVIVAICLIVLLLGPVAHLSLVRAGKREWAWVIVPGASLALAAGMYLVASGVKGEDSALERHAMILSNPGAGEAISVVGIRIQSADALDRSLRLEARYPRISEYWYSAGTPGESLGSVRVGEGVVEMDGIETHRFSTRDFFFSAPVAPVPLGLDVGRDGSVELENASGGAVSDICLRRPGGWARLEGTVPGGERRSWEDAGEGLPVHRILGTPEDSDSPEVASLVNRLYNSIAMIEDRAREFDGEVLVASCEVPRPVEIELSPRPAVTEERTTCVWFFPAGDRPAESAQIAGGGHGR